MKLATAVKGKGYVFYADPADRKTLILANCGTIRASGDLLVTDAGAEEALERSARAIWEKIKAHIKARALRTTWPNIQNLTAVGHSLGAVVAVRIAAHLWTMRAGGLAFRSRRKRSCSGVRCGEISAMLT